MKGTKEGLQISGASSGRVLETGPTDNVFINFVDHGGPGIIAFPNQLLQADDLITVSPTHCSCILVPCVLVGVDSAF